MKTTSHKSLPKIVSSAAWEAAHKGLLKKERTAARARDALAAERRKLPMVAMGKDYAFDAPGGSVTPLNLFERRRQLIVYHFVYGADVGGWPDAGCVGCSFFVHQIGIPAHPNARDTLFAVISPARLAHIQ